MKLVRIYNQKDQSGEPNIEIHIYAALSQNHQMNHKVQEITEWGGRCLLPFTEAVIEAGRMDLPLFLYEGEKKRKMKEILCERSFQTVSVIDRAGKRVSIRRGRIC